MLRDLRLIVGLLTPPFYVGLAGLVLTFLCSLLYGLSLAEISKSERLVWRVLRKAKPALRIGEQAGPGLCFLAGGIMLLKEEGLAIPGMGFLWISLGVVLLLPEAMGAFRSGLGPHLGRIKSAAERLMLIFIGIEMLALVVAGILAYFGLVDLQQPAVVASLFSPLLAVGLAALTASICSKE